MAREEIKKIFANANALMVYKDTTTQRFDGHKKVSSELMDLETQFIESVENLILEDLENLTVLFTDENNIALIESVLRNDTSEKGVLLLGLWYHVRLFMTDLVTMKNMLAENKRSEVLEFAANRKISLPGVLEFRLKNGQSDQHLEINLEELLSIETLIVNEKKDMLLALLIQLSEKKDFLSKF